MAIIWDMLSKACKRLLHLTGRKRLTVSTNAATQEQVPPAPVDTAPRSTEDNDSLVVEPIELAEVPIPEGVTDDAPYVVEEQTIAPPVVERSSSIPPPLPKLPYYERAFSSLYLTGYKLDNLQRAKVEQELLRIVTIESPIHYMQLLYRVSDRLTEKVQVWLAPLIERLLETGQIYQDGNYLLTRAHYELDQRQFPVRSRAILDGRMKAIEYVHPAELRNAVMLIAVHTPAIERAELGRETLKFIGYGRVTTKLAAVIDNAIARLIAEGELVEYDSRVTVTR